MIAVFENEIACAPAGEDHPRTGKWMRVCWGSPWQKAFPDRWVPVCDPATNLDFFFRPAGYFMDVGRCTLRQLRKFARVLANRADDTAAGILGSMLNGESVIADPKWVESLHDFDTGQARAMRKKGAAA